MNKTMRLIHSFVVRVAYALVLAGALSLGGGHAFAATTVTTTCSVVVNNPTPPSVTCSVTPDDPSPGQLVTYTATPAGGATGPYTWTATDPSKCTLGTGATATCRFTAPGQAYDMSVKAGATGPTDTCFTVTTKSPKAFIEAVPDRVNAGDTTDVSWSADQISTCTVTKDGVSVWNTTLVLPAVSISTTTLTPSPTINKQTTFAITCDGAAASDQVIVNIGVNFENF